MRFFNPVIRPKFSLKAAFPFSVGWFRNRTGTSSARKGLHLTSGTAQPLVKPVVWFARAAVNWRSLSVAKSAYYSASRAYFQSKISLLFCFEIPNAGLEIGQNPDPEKPIGYPFSNWTRTCHVPCVSFDEKTSLTMSLGSWIRTWPGREQATCNCGKSMYPSRQANNVFFLLSVWPKKLLNGRQRVLYRVTRPSRNQNSLFSMRLNINCLMHHVFP